MVTDACELVPQYVQNARVVHQQYRHIDETMNCQRGEVLADAAFLERCTVDLRGCALPRVCACFWIKSAHVLTSRHIAKSANIRRDMKIEEAQDRRTWILKTRSHQVGKWSKKKTKSANTAMTFRRHLITDFALVWLT